MSCQAVIVPDFFSVPRRPRCRRGHGANRPVSVAFWAGDSSVNATTLSTNAISGGVPEGLVAQQAIDALGDEVLLSASQAHSRLFRDRHDGERAKAVFNQENDPSSLNTLLRRARAATTALTRILSAAVTAILIPVRILPLHAKPSAARLRQDYFVVINSVGAASV